MIRVGITGGIGSGKSTVCKVWEELGAFVLYADDFAKELMVKDEQVIQAIKHTFGDGAYDEKGRLNRAFLAEEAFEKGRVKELNGIVHPRLHQKISELAQQKEKEGIRVFVKEAAILLNHGRPDDIDVVVMVLAKKERRIERVQQRDRSSEKQIIGRMKKQPDFNSLTQLADYILANNGSLDELRDKAIATYKLISEQENA